MQGFFKNIPNIAYDFKSDGNFSQAKDLFRKVGVFSYLKESITGYNYYRVQNGERPDILANKLYGDPTLYWTFFLVNDFHNYYDWYKSSAEFESYINKKYPGQIAIASSTTPRPAPKCPPVLETISIISDRNSEDKLSRSSNFKNFKSLGLFISSSSGVDMGLLFLSSLIMN